MSATSSFFSVVSRNPLTRFAALVRACESTLFHITIVSPWIINSAKRDFAPLVGLLEAIELSRATCRVLTRQPAQVGHEAALKLCAGVAGVDILTLDNLHAKLYILESRHVRAAIVGSPNFTPSGDEYSRELAIEVRSTRDADLGSELIRDLRQFATDLMCDRAARFHHRGTPLRFR